MELNSSEADMDLLDFAKNPDISAQKAAQPPATNFTQDNNKRARVIAFIDAIEQKHALKQQKQTYSDGENTEEDEEVTFNNNNIESDKTQ